jgi:hypothetical protein
MRVCLLVCTLAMAACAGKPSAAPPAATTYISPGGKPLAAAPLRADGTLDPKTLAAAKSAGYTLVNTHGELLYCRTDMKLGTHIQRNSDTTCFTQQEMTQLHEMTRQQLNLIVPYHTCGGAPPNPPC